MSLKWKMIDYKNFIAKQDDYKITVTVGGAMGLPHWRITKSGVVVDECYLHSPVKSELSAKIQAEKCFQKFINN